MKRLTTSEYIRLSGPEKLLYKLKLFLVALGLYFARFGKTIGHGVVVFGKGVGRELSDLVTTFTKGSWITRVSYIIMGFGNLVRGQILRGLLFLVFEAVFIAYMITTGIGWLGKMKTLGTEAVRRVYNPVLDVYSNEPGDNSFFILLYALLTIIFCIAFIWAWRENIRQNKIAEELLGKGKKLATAKQDLKALVDDKFYKTLLALPMTGIIVFMVLPIVFMIFIAFTNYDAQHNGYTVLFSWVGLENFRNLFSASSGSNLGYTFVHILGWTLVWAFFATFTNYFLGIVVALMINKKGIRFKKMWRGILVLTIAIPQFVSLMYVSKLFSKNGLINGFLMKMGFIDWPIEFWQNSTYARILVIIINIWIGIPYLMLIATGILMNIPADLYESARIDGANSFQQFRKITLPYMLFVTGPYLLTSFIGNINNFNVIYLLTSGGVVANPKYTVFGTSASDTDLLITWLFNITTGATTDYKLAAVIAIMIFVVVSVITVIAYNAMPSNKNEEDFQ